MAKVNSIIRVSCGIAAWVAVWGAVEAFADDSRPYLPTVGPTQLRFYKVQSLKSLKLPPLSMENTVSSDDGSPPKTTDNTPTPGGFASGSGDIPARYFLPTTLWLNHLSGHGEADSTEPAEIYTAASNPPTPQPQSVQPAPASDLLNVTPQMLVDYFKPGHPYQNRGGANTSVYVPVNFNPATPTVTPPSSATYNSSP